ncbi:MAG: NAD(P)/FAD-dependent oxidoreductase [Oscillospiraceae bacterium]|nr:NAD(P)/FAD-dependent oxidoreductase [Oscillospiraceae bacterium]
MEYVIVGNSAAAVGAIEGIRQLDAKGKITVISNERQHTYSRPLISYLLQGKTDRQLMKYRPDSFYADNDCTTVFGKTVTAIDRESKAVGLDDGKRISYDKLLIATGSSPFVPPMTGLEAVEKRFCFMSLDDADALEAALFPEARVLIVGAGLIGLKCAEGILARVGKITVVDLAPRILSSILDEDGAKTVQTHLENQGIEFKLDVSVAGFVDNKAELTSGESVGFDLLVTAVGVRPNVSLVKDAGGKVDRGIIVSEKMETSIPDVYSAGDCVVSHDISCNTDRILAILPNAYIGGKTAGIAMAGGETTENKMMPMNAIGFFGLHIITAGSYEGEVFEMKDGENYKKLFYSNDTLRGYILIGNVDKAGIYTALIREKTPLSCIDFELVCKEPSLIAFTKSYRDEKLGGKSNEN